MPAEAAPGSAAQLGAILLAAGGSRRLGRPKQMLEIGGEPLVLRQARQLLSLGPACLVVVTGSENVAVETALAGQGLRCEFNPDWEKGMGASLARGVRLMPERVRAALVMLCDQWKVTAGELQAMVEAWSADPSAVVAASYEGTLGVPAILPRAMFERLARLEGDSGARRLIRGWHGKVVPIAMPQAAADIDVPGDLAGPAGSG